VIIAGTPGAEHPSLLGPSLVLLATYSAVPRLPAGLPTTMLLQPSQLSRWAQDRSHSSHTPCRGQATLVASGVLMRGSPASATACDSHRTMSSQVPSSSRTSRRRPGQEPRGASPRRTSDEARASLPRLLRPPGCERLVVARPSRLLADLPVMRSAFRAFRLPLQMLRQPVRATSSARDVFQAGRRLGFTPWDAGRRGSRARSAGGTAGPSPGPSTAGRSRATSARRARPGR
jgi:hypothetical protein